MIYLNALGMVNALGNNLAQIATQLARGVAPGMQVQSHWLTGGAPAYFGQVVGELPPIPSQMPQHNTRNNQLLLAALEQILPQVNQAIRRYGAERVAVIMGTSTSGIDEGQRALYAASQGAWPADYYYQQQELGDPSIFLRHLLGTTGPAYTLSTACSSSARAFISGRRLLKAGLVDAVLVGGADSLCALSINGFNSLEALSNELCRPFAVDRCGITIGEGAALVLLSHEPADVALLGAGESSDAWHMSAPDPTGAGAERAMRMALQQGGMTPEAVAYINLHGTATPLNDQMEALAVHRLFGATTPCSSSKHLTGHTLGAAGVIEAALSWLLLTQDLPLPMQDFSHSARDQQLADINLVTQCRPRASGPILSNSFAFGGNNASLLLGRIL